MILSQYINNKQSKGDLKMSEKEFEETMELEELEDEKPMELADAEILGGILVDIKNNVDSKTIVKNVIKCLMNRNDIQRFGTNLGFRLNKGEIEIIEE